LTRLRRALPFCLTLAVACLPFVGPAGEDPYFSAWKRIEGFREVAESLRIETGHYPGDLAEICQDRPQYRLLCDPVDGAPRRDRWGNEIWYEPIGSTYRIGSPGPDVQRGTADDLEVSTEEELIRVRELAGCYLVEPNDEHEHEDRLLVLDTARMNFLSSERAGWAPSPEPFGRPKWHPWRKDSVVVTWAAVGSVVDMRLLPVSDTLRGVLHSPTGTAQWWDHELPFLVSAKPIDCDRTN